MDSDFDPFDGGWTNDPLGEDHWPVDDDWSSPTPDPTGDDHSASPFSVAVATLAGSAAILGLRARWRRGRPEPAVGQPDPPKPAEPHDPVASEVVAPVVDDTAIAERAALVALCVDLDDLLANEAHREKLRRVLRGVGVEVVDPIHERFDPELHCAVGAEPAPRPDDDRRIARVERVGFLDRGKEVRLPEVIVFSHDGGADGS